MFLSTLCLLFNILSQKLSFSGNFFFNWKTEFLNPIKTKWKIKSYFHKIVQKRRKLEIFGEVKNVTLSHSKVQFSTWRTLSFSYIYVFTYLRIYVFNLSKVHCIFL